jgi:hypothetical protein
MALPPKTPEGDRPSQEKSETEMPRPQREIGLISEERSSLWRTSSIE